ncbi:MAG: TPM domain-containing protein [Candidatus Binatus sp.]
MRTRCAWASSVIGAANALLILSLILASPALASEAKFPPLTGRVVDDAGVLNSYTVGELTLMLADHERITGEQVVVVTLRSLQGYPIEDFGYQLGRHWGIGQKGKNNGALLIVVPKEHKVRIEVGYGLEGTLTDATSRTIIEQSILPAFRRGDYNFGVLAGTQAILQVLGGNALSAEPVSHPVANSAAATEGFVVVWCLLFFGPWLIFFINWFRHRHDPIWWAQHRGALILQRVNGGSRSSSWGGGGGGGGDGGGFSGGGGSFGGGGASGSW